MADLKGKARVFGPRLGFSPLKNLSRFLLISATANFLACVPYTVLKGNWHSERAGSVRALRLPLDLSSACYSF